MKKILKYIRDTVKMHVVIQKTVYLHLTQWGQNLHTCAQHYVRRAHTCCQVTEEEIKGHTAGETGIQFHSLCLELNFETELTI